MALIKHKEMWGLAALFLLFIGLTTYYEKVGQEIVPRSVHSAVNSNKEGVRALSLLWERLGLRVEQLKTPWDGLKASDGLLVLIEPLDSDRAVSKEELNLLEKWVKAGGSLLYLINTPNDFNKEDKVTGDVSVIAGSDSSHTVSVAGSDSLYLQNVQSVQIMSGVRLKPAENSGYSVLLKDDQGALAVSKMLGKGQLIFWANSYAATNEGVQQADNAVFLSNIASITTGPTKLAIQFDEYHHGVGFAQHGVAGGDDLWSATPAFLKLVLLHLSALCLLLMYNANRRFGAPIPYRATPLRSSTDYVNSMSRFYKRAGAGDLAAETLYRRFIRDLKHDLDVPSDISRQKLMQRAQQKYGANAAGLELVFRQGDEVESGLRINELVMLDFARQIDYYRRAFNIVGF